VKELSISNIAAAAEAAFVHFEAKPETWICGSMSSYDPATPHLHCFAGQMAAELGATTAGQIAAIGYQLDEFCDDNLSVYISRVNDGMSPAGSRTAHWLNVQAAIWQHIVAPLQKLAK
jgi:hypothetical protein